MRGNLFTAAKVCLAGGCLSATALLLAPSPKGSSQFLASTEATGRAEIASIDTREATAEPALADTAKPIEPPLHRLASSNPDSASLVGLTPFAELDETSHAIDVAFTPVNAPVIERRVPEPTPDPVPQGSFALADELASLRQQVHRLSQAQTRPQQESGADVYGEMRQLIDRFTNAERFRTLEDEVRRLRKSDEPLADKTAVDRGDAEPTSPSADPKPTPPLPSTGPLVRAVPSEFEPDRFTLQVEAADVTQVLDLLGQMAGWNVVAAPGVSGTVTLNLRDVTLDEALASILAPQDFVAERKDNLLFVFPRTQADARAAALRVVATKVYRPNYINVVDLQSLATPLLTPVIGKIAVTSPSAVGLSNDA
ncbi:MAG: secretin and TonB N-terminal domain-containing protein, partial [Planctomycetota bacterium]|nr:secretin and TonB N-terminal domain-containing protein [Planctomycetota bacterium]